MKLEIRIPISPTTQFFRQIEYLARSVRACGGHTARARIVVSVGADIEPFNIEAVCPWSRDQVVWRWVDRRLFRRLSYHATGIDRFVAAGDADIVLLCDADILFIKSLDDILESLANAPAAAGLIAHIPPFMANPDSVSWRGIYEKAGLAFPPDLYQHSGYGIEFNDPRHRFCPAYFNFGAVFVPGGLMEPLREYFSKWLGVAIDLGWEYMSGQIGLTFALADGAIPRIALPPRYNFPNSVAFERGYPQDLADMAVLHYQRTDSISRHRDLNDLASVKRLVARRDLAGTNEVFRSCIERLSPEIEEEA